METFDGIHTVYSGDVQYPYADVGAKELLHISGVTAENRRQFDYVCPCCHERLRPRLGKKNRHCFFHDKGARCAMDKYIHDTAERLLKEKFDRDEPFEVVMQVTKKCSKHDGCMFAKESGHDYCTIHETVTYDLKKHYQKCLVETKYDGFVPDLMLVDETGKREPIFIEIWHKHKSEDTKLNSKYRIIEIRLKKVDELEELTKGPIEESDMVHFFNFKPILLKPEQVNETKLHKFVLYPSLKSYCTVEPIISCSEYREHHYKHPLVEVTALPGGYFDRYEFWQYCLHISRQKGADVKDCYMCRYGRHNKDAGENDEETVYCKCLSTADSKHICKHDYARTCEHFYENQDRFLKLKQNFFRTRLYIWKDEKLVDRVQQLYVDSGKPFDDFE